MALPVETLLVAALASIPGPGLAIRFAVDHWRMRRWPCTTGVVTAAWLELRRDSDHGDLYVPRVNYAYAVDGTTHAGMVIRFPGPMRTSQDAAAERLAKYAQGAPVDVFYDPRKPSSAVLDRSAAGRVVVIAALLAATVAVDALLVVLFG